MYFLPGLCLFLSCVLRSEQTETGIRPIQSVQPQRSARAATDCENDEQCQYFITNSKCINKQCRCSDDLLLKSDGSKCLEKVNEYGSSCEDHVQCSHELFAGGICQDSTCKCKEGYHYLKGFCWKNSDLHEKCVKDEQCFSAYEYIGLRCDNGVCKCRENYYERPNSGCRRERRLNETCNLDKDCVDGSVCERRKCSEKTQDHKRSIESSGSSSNVTFGTKKSRSNCPKGMFELNGTCVLELGMNCKDDRDCDHIPRAFCLDGSVCGCEPATFVAAENSRECLPAALGKTANIARIPCKADPQCGVFGEYSFCLNKKCACRNESYWESENGLCWPAKKLNESCVATADCHPSETKAECIEKVCSCPVGYHRRELICMADAVEVGDPCEDDKECLFENSYCNSSGVCACRKPYYPEKGKCVPGVESRCDSQADCAHLKNTECKTWGNLTQKQCLCLDNHCSSEDQRYCLPVVNFEEKCWETFQCIPRLGELGECRENVCQCRKRAHFSYGKCYESKFIGERCSRLPECYPGNDSDSLICLNGYCSCNYDYEVDEAGICVRTNSGTNLAYYSVSLISALIFIALRK